MWVKMTSMGQLHFVPEGNKISFGPKDEHRGRILTKYKDKLGRTQMGYLIIGDSGGDLYPEDLSPQPGLWAWTDEGELVP